MRHFSKKSQKNLLTNLNKCGYYKFILTIEFWRNFMKKTFLVYLILSVGLALVFISCASVNSVARDSREIKTNVTVGENESLVIVKRNVYYTGMAVSLAIFIDGEELASVKTGKNTSFVIPNGEHRIMVANSLGKSQQSHELSFEAYSMRITFAIGYDLSTVTVPKIIKAREVVLDGGIAQKRAKLASAPGMEGAIYRSFQNFVNNIPQRSIIAVLSISSTNNEMATLAIDDLEYQFVDSKLFTVVDRKTLDSIRSEQNFQMSGDVSDDSAVLIGNMLGANIVITGSITGLGNTQHLTLKALDVKTAQIVTMAREQF
jgi:hypothetical protein